MKLKCNTIQRFISDYIDDTLSSSDTAKVEDHLLCCQVCQHEVAALKKTRDLVVDFYVEPEAPDNYYHQFEVELHRSLENKGPTPLNERLKTSAGQFTWSLLTKLRQSFGRYSLFRRNAFPLGVLLLLIGTGFVATHLLKQEVSLPPKVYPQQEVSPPLARESDNVNEKSELRHGIYNDRETKRKAPGDVSSPAVVTNAEKVGYWKLAEPLTTETEGHIIVMRISNDRSVPSDAADSELIVYAQPDILSRKSPLQDDYAVLPLELQVAPFIDKYQRKHRRLPRFVEKLMDASSEIPTIPELYDLSKL